jgi:hypothetical protein
LLQQGGGLTSPSLGPAFEGVMLVVIVDNATSRASRMFFMVLPLASTCTSTSEVLRHNFKYLYFSFFACLRLQMDIITKLCQMEALLAKSSMQGAGAVY